ncbi:MAG: hypothetical protein IKO94_10270, partial [Selenomonadaceae bacterium]|nr:hypothetical protein [Selenomonadaceae bacterium]
ALNLVSTNMMDCIEIDADINIINFYVDARLQGKKLQDSNLRSKYHLNVIAIVHDNETVITPPPTYVFSKGDKIFAVGSRTALSRFEEDMLKE